MNEAALTPRLDLLLRRLILLAGEVHDVLATGDWEAAVPAQDEFDGAFAQLQRLVETGHAFGPQHANELARLRHVHAENERLAASLHASAKGKVEALDTARRVNTAYAPLGDRPATAARYIDGSA